MAVKGENINSTIGAGSVFEGKFYISGSLRIDGKFEGEIKTDNELVVGESGKVKTDIVAKRVVVAGTLIGNIIASEEVNLLETGRVLGNISTPRLIVEPGVVTEGQVTITSQGSDAVGNIIRNSFGEDAKEIFESIDMNSAVLPKPEKSNSK